MPHLDHLLRALSISIPFGIMFGLIAGYLRKRLGQSLGDSYANKWERLRQQMGTASARYLCGRHFYVRCPGLLLLQRDQADFIWIHLSRNVDPERDLHDSFVLT